MAALPMQIARVSAKKSGSLKGLCSCPLLPIFAESLNTCSYDIFDHSTRPTCLLGIYCPSEAYVALSSRVQYYSRSTLSPSTVQSIWGACFTISYSMHCILFKMCPVPSRLQGDITLLTSDHFVFERVKPLQFLVALSLKSNTNTTALYQAVKPQAFNTGSDPAMLWVQLVAWYVYLLIPTLLSFPSPFSILHLGRLLMSHPHIHDGKQLYLRA